MDNNLPANKIVGLEENSIVIRIFINETRITLLSVGLNTAGYWEGACLCGVLSV